MNEPGSFASLSPSLLARKGGAKPAMRSQLQPIQQATAYDIGNDLGWNDMGEEEGGETGAVVVQFEDYDHAASGKPAVVRQQEALARSVAHAPAQRQSALDHGRRAAFTLRLDADRHLKLRLASTVINRSAQQIVTEALDQFLASMPEVDALASKVRKAR